MQNQPSLHTCILERARLKHCVHYSSDFIGMQLGFKARFSRYVSALVSIMCPNKTRGRADCGNQATQVSALKYLTYGPFAAAAHTLDAKAQFFCLFPVTCPHETEQDCRLQSTQVSAVPISDGSTFRRFFAHGSRGAHNFSVVSSSVLRHQVAQRRGQQAIQISLRFVAK